MNNEIIKTLQIKKETITYDVRTKKDGSKEYARIKFIDLNDKEYALNVNYPLYDKLIDQLATGELPIISETYFANKYGQWTEVKVPFELNPYKNDKKYLFE